MSRLYRLVSNDSIQWPFEIRREIERELKRKEREGRERGENLEQGNALSTAARLCIYTGLLHTHTIPTCATAEQVVYTYSTRRLVINFRLPWGLLKSLIAKQTKRETVKQGHQLTLNTPNSYTVYRRLPHCLD